LADTKALDNKTTLLGYLIQIIEKSYPELKDYWNDLHSVPLCTASMKKKYRKNFLMKKKF
jgi:hypothetical protein